jgi:hypothetical protein
MPESSVEAARYALLRRLAPAIRHRVVGRLHPIGLIAEAVEWQVQDAAPNLANVQENIAKIKSLSQTAMQCFTAQITWLARENGAVTTIGDGIDECLALLHTDFELRGFAIDSRVRAPGLSVSLNALRNVLTSALIAVTDAAPGPAILTLTADVSNQQIVLSMLARPTDGDPGISNEGAYRLLDWDDVDALARAESVKITRDGERVEMRYNIIDKDIADMVPPAT